MHYRDDGCYCFKMSITGTSNNVAFVVNLSAFALASFKIMPMIGDIVSKINSIGVNRPFLNACNDNG